MFAEAVYHHQAGRLVEAEHRYRQILAANHHAYPEAHMNLGYALLQQGRLEEAVTSYRKTLELAPNNAEVLLNLGNILGDLSQEDEAIACYRKALVLKPEFSDVHNSLGVTLCVLGKVDEAIASYRRALEIRPDSVMTLDNLASALMAQGKSAAALTIAQQALESCERAIALRPDDIGALYDRGNICQRLNRFDEAVASYDRVIALDARHAQAYCNRGIALIQLGRFGEARASFSRAVKFVPGLAEAQFGLCMAELPIVYETEEEITRRRVAYARRLEVLCAAVERNPKLARGVGTSQPFYLAYQGMNDRDLQARYGSTICRLMAERYPQVPLASRPADCEPVRIGIVSGYFREHTVWKLMIRGWLGQLDRRRFRVFGYHTGAVRDAETQWAPARCERFVQGPLSVDRWRAAIAADAPHVLIYPEVGMDPVVTALAAQRLAPVQCNSWGHPDTSGMPTLDYFLTSDLMEPDDGEAHYTERLVRLPNLSIYYEPIEARPVPMTREDLGLRADGIAFWCGQSLYKYLPQFDSVFPRIAREVGDCQFAFIHYQDGAGVTELLRRRLGRAFAAAGLDADEHCVFLPRLDQDSFIAATGQCDVFLDSIHWSGGNTTLESLSHSLPIVTLAGPLMRGRHSAAILRRMGITETIAATLDDYVAIAARLAKDASWRATIKARIAANKHRVYRDTDCVAKLEAFLERAARGLRSLSDEALPQQVFAKRLRSG
ncbi:tetratricopeptide repeat protein [Reyranella sp.]|uniref:O-linked N-acetylglucosamine transferase, SPINDLY family protein n=1 Tax=Reyranella sp. TaxID=1929291 RepID=UPI0037848B09